MCGIVGCAGLITGKEERLFRELLVLDTVRGLDSTGVASVGNTWDTRIAKTAGDPFQLFEMHSFKEIMRTKNRVLIGHNRAATTGKVNRANAHPFDFETLVGVHNGTLRNKHVLDDAHKFDTDSEALYHNIEKHGLEKGIEKVNGAYTLVWYDKEEYTLNFLRNNERPMKILFSEDKKTLFFASEGWMLLGLLNREGYKHTQIEDLPIDNHFSYEIPEDGKEFEKAKVRQVKPIPFPATTHTQTTKTTATAGGIKTTGGVGSQHPKAEEIIELFNKRKAKPTDIPEIGIGTRIEGYAKSWGQDQNGSYYVNFLAIHYLGEDFRCYVRNKEEAQKVLCRMYKGTVSKMKWERQWIYHLQPDTLVPSNPKEGDTPVKGEEKAAISNVLDFVIETTKLDHEKRPISKDEFNARYGNCVWCGSPVLWDEEWEALSKDDVICGHCANSSEAQDRIPGLKTGSC